MLKNKNFPLSSSAHSHVLLLSNLIFLFSSPIAENVTFMSQLILISHNIRPWQTLIHHYRLTDLFFFPFRLSFTSNYDKFKDGVQPVKTTVINDVQFVFLSVTRVWKMTTFCEIKSPSKHPISSLDEISPNAPQSATETNFPFGGWMLLFGE